MCLITVDWLVALLHCVQMAGEMRPLCVRKHMCQPVNSECLVALAFMAVSVASALRIGAVALALLVAGLALTLFLVFAICFRVVFLALVVLALLTSLGPAMVKCMHTNKNNLMNLSKNNISILHRSHLQ